MVKYELRGPSEDFKVDGHGKVSSLQLPCLKRALIGIGATVVDCTIKIDHIPDTMPINGKSSRLSMI